MIKTKFRQFIEKKGREGIDFILIDEWNWADWRDFEAIQIDEEDPKMTYTDWREGHQRYKIYSMV